ncbi:hypothetical protein C8J56DRAFT_919639 [Mycena floridula]|nr:hypothetical protein C8J56DRAFT_919639 [Mycena floridula]
MSSDGYFSDIVFDEDELRELEAVEVAHVTGTASAPKENSCDDSFDNVAFDIGDDELAMLDELAQPFIQPVPQRATTSTMGTVQTTLFGDVLPNQASTSRQKPAAPKPAAPNPFGKQAPKTKKWDHTEYAKSGFKRNKGKGKAKARDEDEEQFDEDMEFEQYPAPVTSKFPSCLEANPPPMKQAPDLLEAKHWIYPANQPKRDYQYNIVKNCLFENTIVALPTGLGKTFIAGVVMLNFYRWFPYGKVVFLAPTKPLVAQQIDACHQICGIPGTDAAELNGEVARPLRRKAWEEKRVFYATPQTFMNDLFKQDCEVCDVVLIVIDEAHRASGDYAYNQVVRFMMAHNPHFRLLALTATPGSSPDAVQTLIDGLRISRIEIRNEESLDLKQYIHEKTIEQHVIKMGESQKRIAEPLAKLMDKHIASVKQLIGYQWNPYTLHPFAAQKRSQSLDSNQRWASSSLTIIAKLARAMANLIEGTIEMCYTSLSEIKALAAVTGAEGAEKRAVGLAKKIRDEPMFQTAMSELETQRAVGFPIHPKMDRMEALILNHFGANEDGDSEATKVMVFVSYREAVEQITETLNRHRPLIRATKFVGQSNDRGGKKGMAQKQQLEVIKQFKADVFNVLVATSIGEEGLDIGEVDLIVCYDVQKTPIRMLQRVGRTGRKRAGTVHVLLAESREEFNLDKANDAYKQVQRSILRGEGLELYADVPRMLPDHIKPACIERRMDIVPYSREDTRKKAAVPKSPQRGVKRKRNDAIDRNIPPGASSGFVKAADLVPKGSKKKRKTLPKDFDTAAEDDDLDREILSGIVDGPRRTASTSAAEKPKKKAKLRKTTTMEPSTKRKKPVNLLELTSSQFARMGADNSDDMEIERGLDSSRPGSPARSSNHSPSLGDTAFCVDVIELDSDKEIPSSPRAEVNMAWLLDDEDEAGDIEIRSSSPMGFTTASALPRATLGRFATPDDDSIEIVDGPEPQIVISDTEDIEFVDNPPVASSSKPTPGSSRIEHSTKRMDIPPPPNPVIASPVNYPEPSFPVQRARKRRIVVHDPLLSDDSLMPPPAPQCRLRRQPDPERFSPQPEKRKKREKLLKRKDNPLFDFAAEHSGDDTSSGSSDEEDDVESESDRRFLEELPETQMSPSYDQSLQYRQSLLTQNPIFSKGAVRKGKFGPAREAQQRPQVSSSPRRDDGSDDHYILDTFLVDDEEEISFVDDSSDL